MRNALAAGTIPCTGPPCVLQSLVSYTTGQPSAVLARPSRLGGSLPVAAITLPMRSVISPVIPHGFEFAIIDKAGRVVFHSDAQRNTFEDLFLETDRNRQLRSLVVTGVDGSVRTEYLGSPVPRAREARAGLRLVGRHAVRPADAARSDARVDDGQPPVPRRVHRAVGRRRRPRRYDRQRVALAGSVSQAALLGPERVLSPADRRVRTGLRVTVAVAFDDRAGRIRGSHPGLRGQRSRAQAAPRRAGGRVAVGLSGTTTASPVRSSWS